MSVERRAASRISGEMATLIDAMVATSPLIESESALVRHGLRLAMREAIDLNLIHDSSLRDRIRTYLDQQAVAIGEPLGRN